MSEPEPAVDTCFVLDIAHARENVIKSRVAISKGRLSGDMSEEESQYFAEKAEMEARVHTAMLAEKKP